MPTLLDSPRISLTDAARRLDVNVSTLHRWASTGCRGRVLPTVLIGGRRHVLLADLEAYLEGGRTHGEHSLMPTSAGKRAVSAGRELERRGS